jgi:hypothetical protein
MAKAEREIFRHLHFARHDTDFGIGFYVIRRKNPPAITAEEARRVLEKYGKIRSCQSASPYERLALLVNDAVLVSFQMYDMGQAAMQVKPPSPTVLR